MHKNKNVQNFSLMIAASFFCKLRQGCTGRPHGGARVETAAFCAASYTLRCQPLDAPPTTDYCWWWCWWTG